MNFDSRNDIVLLHMSLVVRKPVSGFPTMSDTNHAVQPQKMVRSLKFQIYKVEGLYYPCSKTKDADQLRGYREADLRLCFRICKIWFSHNKAHIINFAYFSIHAKIVGNEYPSFKLTRLTQQGELIR